MQDVGKESAMLVLSRRVGEKIQIGDDVTIVINRISGNRITLGIDAPRNMRIVRGELERFEDGIEPEPAKERAKPARNGKHAKPVAVPLGDETSSFVPRRAK